MLATFYIRPKNCPVFFIGNWQCPTPDAPPICSTLDAQMLTPDAVVISNTNFTHVERKELLYSIDQFNPRSGNAF